MILIGRPIPLYPKAQPTRFAVRLTRRRRTGRKWTRFSALVCRNTRRTVPRWFCSPFGGREGRSSGSRQASKCQVSSVKCKRTGVVLRTCPSSLFPPPRRQINGALYMLGGNTNVCAVSAVRYLFNVYPLSNAFRLVSSRLVVYRWERLCMFC